jgi:competence ComEA-like helix-hairpin-helix protein
MKSVHHRIIAAAITLFLIVATALIRLPEAFHLSNARANPDFAKQFCGPAAGRPAASRRHLCGVGVDLNRDTETELQYLPGIGPERARAIVQYRDYHGPFRNVDELIRVPGIGPKLLANVQPFIEPI